MGTNRGCACVVVGVTVLLSAGTTSAQGVSRPMGKPFSGRLSTVPVDPAAASPTAGSGTLYSVLLYDGVQYDGKGKLQINGTFEGLNSPATAAHFHRGPEGQPGPKVSDLTVTKAKSGVIKGSVTLTGAEVEELTKGSYYLQIDTEKNPDGEVRGWLLAGMLK